MQRINFASARHNLTVAGGILEIIQALTEAGAIITFQAGYIIVEQSDPILPDSHRVPFSVAYRPEGGLFNPPGRYGSLLREKFRDIGMMYLDKMEHGE